MNSLVANSGVRFGMAAVLGVITAFLLTVLMYLLILNTEGELDEQPARKISDIWQPDRVVSENLKEKMPEKVDEPDEPPPDLPDQNVDMEMDLDAVSIAGLDLSANINIGLGGGFARDTDYIPLYVPQPMYPRRALSRGKEGYAVIEVIITTTGGVRDPVLLEEQPKNFGFGRAALKAANKLKYNPRVVDGKAEEVPGVLYKFSFELED
ncbi:MAG: energy transducer TonB [Cellvibrionales bacterium]|nr:MAG: energy transducer TonB [Cellvibrionales bacterium]